MQVNVNSTPETPLAVRHDHFPDSDAGPFGTLTLRSEKGGFVAGEVVLYFTGTADLDALIDEAMHLRRALAGQPPVHRAVLAGAF